MSEEITGYDPASGVYVVRAHYELDSKGHLEVEKSAMEYGKVAELDTADFTLVRSFEVDAKAQLKLKKVFIEGRINVKPDPNTALKDFPDGFVLYKGFHTYEQLEEGRLPNVMVKGKFLHLESDKYYEVGIGNASITQPLKQNEYAFIATRAGIMPPSD